ncbi:MAG: Scr1 family TA system antitoxin-like transcriptional regulator, partial [Thermocrispum sp.]
QVRHLIDAGESLPHVTVQMLPLESGGRAATSTPVTLLRLGDGGLPDIVFLEQSTGGVYPDSPAHLHYHWHAMNRLATEAAPPTATGTLLRWILSDL